MHDNAFFAFEKVLSGLALLQEDSSSRPLHGMTDIYEPYLTLAKPVLMAYFVLWIVNRPITLEKMNVYCLKSSNSWI
jgi:hypothetical protein